MLTEIRDRSTGWFAWIIAGIIIIVMAFWGIQDYASTDANPALVEIGDRKITQNEFRGRLNSEQQRVRQQMGERVNEEILRSDQFKRTVLDGMISRAVLEDFAAEENYRVSDAELARAIRSSEFFQLDGEFNQDAYDRYLVGSQYSKTKYEEILRQDLSLQQVAAGYQESALVSPDEVRLLLEAQVERRAFDVVTLRQQQFVDDVSVSDADIDEYYQLNQVQYMQPQKISLDYIEINMDQLSEEISVSEQEMRDLYEQNKESYVAAETREVRHILLATQDDNKDAQLAKAKKLVSELSDGADFADYAKQHSEDPGSASNGGSLGEVEPGQMVPEFDAAAFSLVQGAVSQPIETQYGYHIVQVVGIKPETQQSFDDVRLELLQALKDQKAEEQLLSQADLLRDLAFEQPDNLDTAAEELGLELQSTEFFTREMGEGIASNPLVRSAAFSEEVLVEELNSELIELSPRQTVVLRKNSVQEAAPQPLVEVKDQVRSSLIRKKASEVAMVKGTELLNAARADWQRVVSDSSLEQFSYDVSLVDRNPAVPPQVLQRVMSLHVGDPERSIDSVVDVSGDVHIIRLTSVAAGNIGGISEQVKEATRRIVAERNGAALFSQHLEQLKQERVPEVSFDNM